MSAKTASMVIPTRRNGSDTSQTNGRRMSASTARGQDSANKIHQPRKMKTAVMVILCSFLPRTSTARRKTLPPANQGHEPVLVMEMLESGLTPHGSLKASYKIHETCNW